MSDIAQITAPIDAHLKVFQKHFREALRSRAPLLDRVMYYIYRRKGKQMRPMFVFLSADVCGGVQEASYDAASLVELLHTATLVHDDVVDDSLQRRGFFSINALWKNKIAVLVGDYLLAKGLLLALDNNRFRVLQIVSSAVRDMSEGELLQIEKARRLDIREEIYYEIIRQKTASLIAAACAAGASSAGADEEIVERMRLFGEKAGIAFQIRDDLFDFGDGDAGKPQGNDLKEKKMTLPLIYALNQSDNSTRRRIINIIKNHNTEPDRIIEVTRFVNESGGMDYSRKVMHDYCRQAYDILDGFPDSEAKRSLKGLVDYTISRTH